MENRDRVKLGEREDLEKTLKIPALLTTIVPLATPTFELGTPVGTNEQSRLDYSLAAPGRLIGPVILKSCCVLFLD